MLVVIWLFLTTLVLGPAGSIAFAFEQGIPPLETAIAVSVIHAALVPVWFGVFGLINYELRYRERFIHKILGETRSRKLKRTIDRNIQEFERRVGQFGFGAGVVGFTFLFGVSWAALGAYLLNIKKRTMMIAVAIGAIASALLWTLAFTLLGGSVPSPWVLYAIGTILTFAVIEHKKLNERKLLREMSKSLRKLGIKMK